MASQNRRYRSFSGWLQEIFGFRVHKVSLDAGFTCPNRDGYLSSGGCIYCDNEGFSFNTARGVPPLASQLEDGMAYMRRRFKAEKFIAYFQAFSSTYGPLERLQTAYDVIRDYPEVVGLFISTRPDCVGDKVLDLIASYRSAYLLCLELGLQSASDRTLRRIGRGHSVADFVDACERAAARNLPVCAHVIIGLPGEGRAEVLQTAALIGRLALPMVKIHSLHVLTDTPLAEDYRAGRLRLLELEEYASLVCDFLERLPGETVIQRLAVDVRPGRLVAPQWCRDKKDAVAAIERELAKRDTRQGALFGEPA